MKASSWVTCFALVQLFLLALAIIYRIKEKYAIYGGTGTQGKGAIQELVYNQLIHPQNINVLTRDARSASALKLARDFPGINLIEGKRFLKHLVVALGLPTDTNSIRQLVQDCTGIFFVTFSGSDEHSAASTLVNVLNERVHHTQETLTTDQVCSSQTSKDDVICSEQEKGSKEKCCLDSSEGTCSFKDTLTLGFFGSQGETGDSCIKSLNQCSSLCLDAYEMQISRTKQTQGQSSNGQPILQLSMPIVLQNFLQQSFTYFQAASKQFYNIKYHNCLHRCYTRQKLCEIDMLHRQSRHTAPPLLIFSGGERTGIPAIDTKADLQDQIIDSLQLGSTCAQVYLHTSFFYENFVVKDGQSRVRCERVMDKDQPLSQSVSVERDETSPQKDTGKGYGTCKLKLTMSSLLPGNLSVPLISAGDIGRMGGYIMTYGEGSEKLPRSKLHNQEGKIQGQESEVQGYQGRNFGPCRGFNESSQFSLSRIAYMVVNWQLRLMPRDWKRVVVDALVAAQQLPEVRSILYFIKGSDKGTTSDSISSEQNLTEQQQQQATQKKQPEPGELVQGSFYQVQDGHTTPNDGKKEPSSWQQVDPSVSSSTDTAKLKQKPNQQQIFQLALVGDYSTGVSLALDTQTALNSNQGALASIAEQCCTASTRDKVHADVEFNSVDVRVLGIPEADVARLEDMQEWYRSGRGAGVEGGKLPEGLGKVLRSYKEWIQDEGLKLVEKHVIT